MSRLFLLITFVQHLDPLDVFFTEVVFWDHIPKFDVSFLSHHGLEHPFLLGESVFAVEHDGVVVERSQQPILRGCQLEELVFQAFKERHKECFSFSADILFLKGQQVIFIYFFQFLIFSLFANWIFLTIISVYSRVETYAKDGCADPKFSSVVWQPTLQNMARLACLFSRKV